MKRKLLLLILVTLNVYFSYAGTYTFKVVANENTQVCYLVGGLNGWNPAATLMTKVSDSPRIFSVDVELTDEQTTGLEYKYCAGPAWKYEQEQAANFKFSEMTEAGDTVNSFKAYYDPGQEADVTINVLVPNTVFVCYLTGSFNGWNSNSNPMNLVSETVNGKEFALTIHTKDTTTLEFKFLAGPGWPYEQTNSANYKYATDGGTVVCDAFKSIYDPSKVGDITINITVPAGTDEVWVVGSYNGWSMATSVQATKNQDGTYTAVIPKVADIEYKIWCHNDWAYEEAANAEGAGLPSNRVASFETGPVFNITVAYWKKLYEIPAFKVTVPDEVKVVYIAGGFNNWNPAITEMTKVSDNPKVFTFDMELTDEQKASMEYKYLAGPSWKYEQEQAANFKYSEMAPAGDTVNSFKAYYDPGQEADVTINVLVPNTVFVCYLTGSFNGWNSNSNPMTLVSETVNGKEFALTIHTKDTTTLEFKFLAGPGWPYEQTNSANYKYATDGGTVVCDAFKAIYDPSKVGDITINITVPEGTEEVWVVGSYNGWSMATSVQATKNQDGTYTAVIPQVADIEYKIWCHNDWAYEEAANAEGAGLPSNRVASFETGPVFNITVAYWKKLFSSTAAKGDITINITVPEGTEEVWVVGSYNGWSMATSVQATKNTDGTYTAVIPQVTDIEYKIWCHNDWAYEEAADAEGTGLSANRSASFATGPEFKITVAYWKKLFTTSVKQIPFDSYKAFSRNGQIVVEGATSEITVFDLNGRTMEKTEVYSTYFTSRFLKSGIYILRVDNQSQKIYVH